MPATPERTTSTGAQAGSKPARRPSRRHVAQGAAWTVPVLAVAAAAPAHAVSPVPCPATTTGCLVHNNSASLPTWTTAVGDRYEAGLCGTDSLAGTYVSLNLGSIYVNPACAPAGTTGFKIDFTSVTAKDNLNVSHTGRITVNCSGCVYVNGPGYGGALNLGAQFDDFYYYNSCLVSGWTALHYLKSYTIGYTITYLRWLDGTTYEELTAPCPYLSTITATGDGASYLEGYLTKIS